MNPSLYAHIVIGFMITMSLINHGRGNSVAGDTWRGDEKRFIRRSLPFDYHRVVDVGGANGSFLRACMTPTNRILYVVDAVTPENVHKNVEFIRGDILSLPFKDNSFDLVFARSVVHHVPDDVGKAMSELHRVLKKGGMCIVSEPLSTPWGCILRRISSSYHDPDEKPLSYDELFSALCVVFPSGTGKGFGVFAPWLSFLSRYLWIPQWFIKLMYHFDRWLIKNSFYTMVYQMVWVMEK